MQDHERVWIPDAPGSTPFFFTGDFHLTADLPDEEVTRRLSSGETPGSDGQYTEPDAPRDSRSLLLRGIIDVDTLTDLQDKFDELALGIPQMQPGKFIRRIVDLKTGEVLRSRYLRCFPNRFKKSGERGLPNADWEIELRTLGDKVLYYEEQARTVNLTVPAAAGIATTNLTLGGVAEVLPRIQLTVSSVGTGGTITVSHNYAKGFARFSPSSAGTWTLDFDPDSPGQGLTFAGLSQMGAFSGSFPPFLARPSTLTLIVGGQVVVSSAQLVYRRRYLTP